jgi:cytoskeletal protein CcmA (bactofilin family)
MNIFSRKPKLNSNRIDSLVGESMTIKGGVVEYSDSLLINGSVFAKIAHRTDSKGTTAITVGEAGVVETDELTADFVIVSGTIRGKVTAKQQLVIEPTGSIIGDASYGSIVIKPGGSIEGKMSKFPGKIDESAQPLI